MIITTFWPSGLRRYVQVVVSQGAWVRIPQTSFYKKIYYTITSKYLDFFNMAQNVMHTFITPECIRTHAAHTFQKGVDAINCNPGIAEAFTNIFDAKTPKDLIQALRKPVLTKFFNQAGGRRVLPSADFLVGVSGWA